MQVETHPGGTRWNPTQEQIGILEMLYRGGMRTPNAQQIEQITAQLGKYGKIEGKNVFYWFQNHKARERQKQKRNSLGLSHCPRTPAATASFTTTISLDSRVYTCAIISFKYIRLLNKTINYLNLIYRKERKSLAHTRGSAWTGHLNAWKKKAGRAKRIKEIELWSSSLCTRKADEGGLMRN